ncbi:MAG: hypothetical protein K8I29_13840 [Alphaproteobacteria bacterium]|uniref:Uncharacterized protein n=1 Tax=Candidatus Nitrobium versatile TaxID=2884831 RepID=A0A953M2B5_9BACT|nr:hypothetical protein [Candidatus Nitrobium versatile]
MKDIILLQDRLGLVEQELKTLADKVIKLETSLKEMDDLKLELKALKIFLGRMHPDFKIQFPEILAKM